MNSRLAFLQVFALLVACGIAVFATGCGDRSSPAAPPAVVPNPPVAAETKTPSQDPSATQPEAVAKPPVPAVAEAQPKAIRDISFDTIKFDMKKEDPFQRSMITPAIEKLQESKIRIRGYIYPPFQQTGLKQFVLVRDNMQCCFGPGAALYDCMIVQMDEGKTIDYTSRPITVDGIFSIQELRDNENNCKAIYRLQADKVQ